MGTLEITPSGETGGIDDRAYLSVIVWPGALDETARIGLLIEAAGLDPYNARLAVRRGEPQVSALIDAGDAPRAVGVLRGAGVEAVAPVRGAMASLPGAVRAMRAGHPKSDPSRLALSFKGDGQGESSVSFAPDEVSAVLRASVHGSKTTTDPDRGSGARVAGAMMLGGVLAGAVAASNSPGPDRRTTFSTIELVEVQLWDGRRYRLDGRAAPDSRSERLKSGKERMDELAAQLCALCPGAWADRRFGDFRCPPDVLQTATSVTGSRLIQKKDDGPLFEFYSAWTVLMLRELAAGESGAGA